MPEIDFDKKKRPDAEVIRDLDGREHVFPPGSIKRWMVESYVGGLEIGRYGRTSYGRCIYGARYGIYGYDRYGHCRYS